MPSNHYHAPKLVKMCVLDDSRPQNNHHRPDWLCRVNTYKSRPVSYSLFLLALYANLCGLFPRAHAVYPLSGVSACLHPIPISLVWGLEAPLCDNPSFGTSSVPDCPTICSDNRCYFHLFLATFAVLKNTAFVVLNICVLRR